MNEQTSLEETVSGRSWFWFIVKDHMTAHNAFSAGKLEGTRIDKVNRIKHPKDTQYFLVPSRKQR